MKEFNILISSVGRQSFLVNAFKNALNGRGRVLVTDFNKDAIAFSVADKHFKAPPYTDLGYVDWLIELCRFEYVKLVISLNVDELILLEENRTLFKKIGCNLVGGPLNSIKMSMDKLFVMHFCQEYELPVIKTLLGTDPSIYELQFPLIAKPRLGKGSRGVKKLTSEKEMNDFLLQIDSTNKKDEFVFQEIMEGDEYGFDLINNFNREFAGVLVRKKLSMKNGETEEAITMENGHWNSFAKKVCRAIQHEGLIDVDAIIINDQPYLMDINFRFGGGYIFSHLAGANVPQAYVSWLVGEEHNPKWLRSKTGISNCRSVFQTNLF